MQCRVINLSTDIGLEKYRKMQRKVAESKTYEERMESLPTWEEIPVGLIEYGPRPGERNIGFTTSFSRSLRPIVDQAKCTDCKLCWLYCPEGTIDYDIKVNLDYCTGCAICAKTCGPKAITMKAESQILAGFSESEFPTMRELSMEFGY